MAGRKSYWDSRIKPRLEEIKAWCRDGHTDKEMCKSLDVSVSTFNKYKSLKPELMESLKVNKEIADQTVVNSLYKRATGFEFEETTEKIKTDIKGNTLEREVKNVSKILVGDVTAQIFWLKNRCKEWTDRKNLEVSGPGGKPIETITSDMDPKKAAQIYAQMLKGEE